MRILLLSDTHGRLDIINKLARKHNCDMTIHAGDFGFYDAESYANLSQRELKLQIIHSDLPDYQKKEVILTSCEQQREFVQKNLSLSDLPAYAIGEKAFSIPIYAVWGNHEDIKVVEKFYSGEYSIHNLTVLHEKRSYHIDGIHLFGLGGNHLFGKKLLQKPIAGGGGKIWTSLSQYAQLIKTVNENSRNSEYRIMVSHVSPGKERFIQLLGIHTSTNMSVSGHMGSPFSMVWNDFSVCSPAASKQAVIECVNSLKSLFGEIDQKKEPKLWESLETVINCPLEEVSIGGGEKASEWYREMYKINLPDAEVGHAVLEIDGKKIQMETYAQNQRKDFTI